MSQEQKPAAWEESDEEVRRLFTLTPDDLYFLRSLRVDTQRLYRALVLVWARVDRNGRCFFAGRGEHPCPAFSFG